MSDLISRQDVIDTLIGCPTEAHYPSWYVEKIKALPSTEPERKTGHWIIKSDDYDFAQWTECSECGYQNNYIRYFKFCPNCGADMRVQ